jgi:hypothetical protein
MFDIHLYLMIAEHSFIAESEVLLSNVGVASSILLDSHFPFVNSLVRF